MKLSKQKIADSQRSALKRVMAFYGLTVNAWCKKAGISEGTLRNFLSGVSGAIGSDNLELLANAIGITVGELLGTADQQQVPVVADVGAGAKIFPFDDLPLYRNGLREADKPYANCETVEVPPGYNAAEVLAVRVKGDSMLPFMPEGTIVYYSNRNGHIEDCLKKLCVVQTKDGAAYLKILKKGEKYGRYNLMSYNASELEGVEIAWAAKVVFVKMG